MRSKKITFATGSAMAAGNPFAMQQLNSGYNVAMSEGTCGEGKGDKAKETK
jgi:uncharacterized low-complexity protein